MDLEWDPGEPSSLGTGMFQSRGLVANLRRFELVQLQLRHFLVEHQVEVQLWPFLLQVSAFEQQLTSFRLALVCPHCLWDQRPPSSWPHLTHCHLLWLACWHLN